MGGMSPEIELQLLTARVAALEAELADAKRTVESVNEVFGETLATLGDRVTKLEHPHSED